MLPLRIVPPFGGREDARDGGERPALGGYASGLETESTLEAIFLELTGGQATSGREGTFQGVSAARSGGSVEPGGPTIEGPG